MDKRKKQKREKQTITPADVGGMPQDIIDEAKSGRPVAMATQTGRNRGPEALLVEEMHQTATPQQIHIAREQAAKVNVNHPVIHPNRLEEDSPRTPLSLREEARRQGPVVEPVPEFEEDEDGSIQVVQSSRMERVSLHVEDCFRTRAEELVGRMAKAPHLSHERSLVRQRLLELGHLYTMMTGKDGGALMEIVKASAEG